MRLDLSITDLPEGEDLETIVALAARALRSAVSGVHPYKEAAFIHEHTISFELNWYESANRIKERV